MIQVSLTVVLTLAVLLVVIWFWKKATRAKAMLDQRLHLLGQFLTKSDDPQSGRQVLEDPDLALKLRGMKLSPAVEGAFILNHMRAQSHTHQIQIVSAVEIMPQIGLLGTVLGLIFSLFLPASGGLAGLALALFTTLVGLLASIICKVLVEVPGLEKHHTIIELLQDERIISAITEKPSFFEQNDSEQTTERQNAEQTKE